MCETTNRLMVCARFHPIDLIQLQRKCNWFTGANELFENVIECDSFVFIRHWIWTTQFFFFSKLDDLASGATNLSALCNRPIGTLITIQWNKNNIFSLSRCVDVVGSCVRGHYPLTKSHWIFSCFVSLFIFSQDHSFHTLRIWNWIFGLKWIYQFCKSKE